MELTPRQVRLGLWPKYCLMGGFILFCAKPLFLKNYTDKIFTIEIDFVHFLDCLKLHKSAWVSPKFQKFPYKTSPFYMFEVSVSITVIFPSLAWFVINVVPVVE